MKHLIIGKTWLMAGLLIFATNLTAQSRLVRRPALDRQHPASQFTRPRPGGLLTILKAKQQELDVTDEQLARIEELQGKLEKLAVEHRNAQNTRRLELKQSLRDQENRDFDSLKTMLLETAQARVDFRITQLQMKDQISDVLTAEQKDALKQMERHRIEQRRDSIRGRMPAGNAGRRWLRRDPEISPFLRNPEDIR